MNNDTAPHFDTILPCPGDVRRVGISRRAATAELEIARLQKENSQLKTELASTQEQLRNLQRSTTANEADLWE